MFFGLEFAALKGRFEAQRSQEQAPAKDVVEDPEEDDEDRFEAEARR